jgi:hypothetical protein
MKNLHWCAVNAMPRAKLSLFKESVCWKEEFYRYGSRAVRVPLLDYVKWLPPRTPPA